ncbi:MAG: Fe-S protein assembly co-chaperone HscB [Chitinophagaceae bacterium]
MNHFELFELPIQLKVDPKDLPRKYMELSKKFHPDYYAQATPSEQAIALERSAQLNEAFKVFKDPVATIRYVLTLKKLMEPEEKYTLSQDFLLEVLELNEQLMDLRSEPNPELVNTIGQQVAELGRQIDQEVAPVISNYQEGVTAESALLQVKEYYYRKKYLDRMLRQLEELGYTSLS